MNAFPSPHTTAVKHCSCGQEHEIGAYFVERTNSGAEVRTIIKSTDINGPIFYESWLANDEAEDTAARELAKLVHPTSQLHYAR